jgi:fluoroacetyl-CoA thioesterase
METLVGLHAQIERVVGADDTAEAWGSGDVAVLATPRLIAWLEAATLTALGGRLSPGTTTVGTSVAVRHHAPSPIGEVVMLRARLVRHDGRRVEFAVEAESGAGKRLADGSVIRAIVERARFLGGL